AQVSNYSQIGIHPQSFVLSLRLLRIRVVIFFFFKQKTAYELGLGIPAEPLFRSTLFPYTPTAISIFVCLSMVQLMAVFISMRCTLCGHFLQEIGRASCRERV